MALPFILPPAKLKAENLLHDHPYAVLRKNNLLESGASLWDISSRCASFESLSEAIEVRRKFITKFGYSVFSRESLNLLAELIAEQGTFLEAGAGTGYLTKSLLKRGLVGTAVDAGGASFDDYGFKRVIHRDIEAPVDSLDFSSYAIVIMAWPEYRGPMSKTVVDKMASGQILVYVGEDEGGCTGCDEYFEEVSNTTKWLYWAEFSDRLNSTHCTFPGVHDRFFVYEKL